MVYIVNFNLINWRTLDCALVNSGVLKLICLSLSKRGTKEVFNASEHSVILVHKSLLLDIIEPIIWSSELNLLRDP